MGQGQQEKDISVCFRLREERVRLGKSQQDLAEELGMNVKTVTRWEKSVAIPADRLAALACIGIDVLYVVTGQRTPPPAELDSKASALLDNYQHMSPEDQAALSRLADSLAQPEKKIKDRTA